MWESDRGLAELPPFLRLMGTDRDFFICDPDRSAMLTCLGLDPDNGCVTARALGLGNLCSRLSR